MLPVINKNHGGFMHRFLVVSRLIAVALGLFFISVQSAAANQPQLVTGSGTREGWTFSASVRLMADQTAEGSFVLSNSRWDCTFTAFRDFVVQPYQDAYYRPELTGKIASFYGTGVCTGEPDWAPGTTIQFEADCRFGLVDYGEPGRRLDLIDINGPVGIPGGPIQTGNIQVREAAE